MKVGIILLAQNDGYLTEDGKLPKRPDFDKGLLEALIKDQEYLCTDATDETLPKRLKNMAKRRGYVGDYDLNLGIATLYRNPPHLLIVVRSSSIIENGRYFDIGQWECKVVQDSLELWILRRF